MSPKPAPEAAADPRRPSGRDDFDALVRGHLDDRRPAERADRRSGGGRTARDESAAGDSRDAAGLGPLLVGLGLGEPAVTVPGTSPTPDAPAAAAAAAPGADVDQTTTGAATGAGLVARAAPTLLGDPAARAALAGAPAGPGSDATPAVDGPGEAGPGAGASPDGDGTAAEARGATGPGSTAAATRPGTSATTAAPGAATEPARGTAATDRRGDAGALPGTAGPEQAGAPAGAVAATAPATGTAGSTGAGSGTAAAPNPVTAQVAPVVTRLVSRGDGVHRLSLRLHPADLGEVRVTLTVRAGRVDVSLAAGPGAREALREGSPHLRSLLELTGATAGNLTVRELTGPAGAPATTSGGSGSASGQPGTTQQHLGQDAGRDARGGSPLAGGSDGSGGSGAHGGGAGRGGTTGPHGGAPTGPDVRPAPGTDATGASRAGHRTLDLSI
ncbi:flagellar hook-length control protein FliK [Nocardioides sp. WL0053]|uniref:Flagellar hook-length control protein FliK n=1 Tax=Nocardioides jiangsuensis TaxID=2866161 RepID=A0ABS7RG68_9ACTN|nr:flagellar hook-length control protein FliK [Nocardioides jiangsuensis]MBY9074031.1 flagellar hook-length control protein FliK [Nocardioides jiangsuensis]